MKKISLAIVTIIAGCLSVLSFSSNLQADTVGGHEPPATIVIDYLAELYTPVEFDHQMHVDMYDCNSCHHHTAGTEPQADVCKRCHTQPKPAGDVSCLGCHKKSPMISSMEEETDKQLYHIDMVSLKGALHLRCLGCHRDEGGPVECVECHTFTQAGEKRFAVKN